MILKWLFAEWKWVIGHHRSERGNGRAVPAVPSVSHQRRHQLVVNYIEVMVGSRGSRNGRHGIGGIRYNEYGSLLGTSIVIAGSGAVFRRAWIRLLLVLPAVETVELWSHAPKPAGRRGRHHRYAALHQ